MGYIDYSFIGVYFVLLAIIAVYLRGRDANTDDFFTSGRNIHWALAGFSMVATTFAADTPLAVTLIVARDGISGNWIWWNFALSGMLTVFFFSHLWKRSGVSTDLEFIELRYSGKPARFLRIFRALYLSIGINSIILGWVTIGMGKILAITMDWPVWASMGILYLITSLYIIFTGLRGVIIADFFQFIIALAGSFFLAFTALDYLGGLDGMRQKILDAGLISKTHFFPWENSLDNWVIWLAMMWWASWYPGAEPGGGGYIAQRMFSTRNEKDSLYATILFNVMHYAFRPWPWIIVAFASILVFPSLDDPEKGYPMMMTKLLSSPFLGIMMTGFLAAFMSTLSTHLNWAASYLVHDIYRESHRRRGTSRSENHYLLVSRMAILFAMGLSFITSYFFDTVKGAWEFLLALGAGTGPVYLLRWYWWRINAWSEISAMAGAALITGIFYFFQAPSLAFQLLVTTGATTFLWLSVTFLTKPVEDSTLLHFFRKVKPGLAGFKGFFDRMGENPPMDSTRSSLRDSFILWISSVVMIYSLLFGVGFFLFGQYPSMIISAGIFLGSGTITGIRLRGFIRSLDGGHHHK